MVRVAARLLAVRLRKGPASSVLVALVLATAGAAGTSAVLVRSAATGPWDRAFAATHGAHVRVSSFGALDARGLAGLPGVVESSGPVVASVRELRHGGATAGVALVAVPEGLRVDRPFLVEGGWRPGAVVLERSFSRALGVSPGDRVEIAGRAFDVSGIALSVRNAGFPATVPGSAFTDPVTAAAVGSSGPLLTTVGLRLADPSAEAGVAEAASRYGVVSTASAVRADALARTRQFQVVLTSFTILLLAAAGFLVAVLVGARLRAQSRELVLLRLVGVTPGQLVALVAVEHAVLALVGGLVGAAAGLAGAGRLAGAAATALGTTAPDPGPAVPGVLGVLVITAAATGAFVTRRTARLGITGLSAAAPHRPSAAAGRVLAAGLPAPAALVAKEVGFARGRALATVLAVALAVTATVAALGMEATFRESRQAAAAPAPPPPAGLLRGGAPHTVDDESGLRTLVYGLQGLLALVALASIVAVGLVGVRERRRELAVLSAVGFSLRQLAASTVAAQGMLGGLGALAGIPLGIGFFRLAYGLANGSSAGLADAPVAQLAAVVPAAMVVAALVAALPASSLRRLPVSAALAPS